MPALRLLLNLIWIVAGGIWMAAAWLVAALVLAITIIGLPWARSALNIAFYTFLPFGHRVVSRDALTGRPGLTDPVGAVRTVWVMAAWAGAVGSASPAVARARAMRSGRRLGMGGCLLKVNNGAVVHFVI